MTRPGLEVWVENRQKRRISKARLKAWTRKLLRLAGPRRAGLSLVLVDDRQIRRLHRQHLGEDRPTDVLAFAQREGKEFPRPGIPVLGDVVVSVERAWKEGPRFGNRGDEELLLYVLHGILHLRGYRDEKRDEKARMEERQKEILRKALGRRWQSRRRKPLF